MTNVMTGIFQSLKNAEKGHRMFIPPLKGSFQKVSSCPTKKEPHSPSKI